MKLLAIIGLAVVAAGAGAGTVFVADKLYWDNELKVQVADRDKLIEGLNTDLTGLRSRLGQLQETNDKIRGSIESSMKSAVAVANSNKSAREKLNGVIDQLETLLADLEKLEEKP